MKTRRNPKRVFISHAREDRALAAKIHSVIDDSFPGCFQIFNAFDGESLVPSDEFRKKITNAVIETDLLILLLTKHSLTKPWIYWESGGAYHRGVRVLPILGPGCDLDNIPDPVSELLAINLTRSDGALQLLDYLARFGSKRKLKYSGVGMQEELGTAVDLYDEYIGKTWSGAATEVVKLALSRRTSKPCIDIRVVSYTSETLANSLLRQIADTLPPNRQVRVRILLRNEYAPFHTRLNNPDYNQRVRWRITRAKAMWYETLEHVGNKAIDLEIRDYWWDPSVRMLLIGDSEGYLGMYTTKVQGLSGTTNKSVPEARDWVAAETAMGRIGEDNAPLLHNLISWFDQVWVQEGSRKSNDRYRSRRSSSLLTLSERIEKKDLRELTHRWYFEGRYKPDDRQIGDIALPVTMPDDANYMIEFIGACVLSKSGQTVLVTEERAKNDEWEGIGKTNAVLELLDLQPKWNLPDENKSVDFTASPNRQPKNKRVDASWLDSADRSEFCLFASDIIWAFEYQHKLCITRPEGEYLWGLWDVARYVLRDTAAKIRDGRTSVNGLNRTDVGRRMNEQLFLSLPMKPLLDRYSSAVIASPDVIVVLRPNVNRNLRALRTPREKRDLLLKAIVGARYHPSGFWRVDGPELLKCREIAESLLDAVHEDSLPIVYELGGNPPFHELSSRIREILKGITPL